VDQLPTDKILVALRGAAYGTVAFLVLLSYFEVAGANMADYMVATVWMILVIVGIGVAMYNDTFKSDED